MTDKLKVLVLGATGLFGELLVRRLVREQVVEVICASRGKSALKEFSASINTDYVVLNRDDTEAVHQALETIRPFAVIDCAGPFQYYGDKPYLFAQIVLEAGSHYLDIADAPEFVSGIVELDNLAKSNEVTAISGVSTTPAISAAVADELTLGLSRVISIETAIIPGNRARRTFSVMKAILGQIGHSFDIVRHGKQESVVGWSETRTIALKTEKHGSVSNRLAALIHTPDVDLFPSRYRAETVTFYAGLEIRSFHRALQLGSLLVRIGALKSLSPFAAFARWTASWFESLGSDIGGMQVSVRGQTPAGDTIRRNWDLIASDGYGPEIPTLPVSILLTKLIDKKLATGARTSPGEILLKELEVLLENIGASTNCHESIERPLFKQVLGIEFESLPGPLLELHTTTGQAFYKGIAQTNGPTGLSGRIAAKLVGFPAAGEDIPVSVTITSNSNTEFWVREFDGHRFHSTLSLNNNGLVQERFGPLSLQLGLTRENDTLQYPVVSGKLFGCIPVPGFLLPQSITHEEVDQHGRFVFDVLLKTPFGARIVHYRGWLVRTTDKEL